MDYSAIIKNLRKAKQLNQDELADLLGLKRHTICDWETGRTEPNINALIGLSNTFNVPVHYILNAEYTGLNEILTFDEQNKYTSFIPSTQTEDELFNIIDNLDGKQISYLSELIKISEDF
jgi:transcriptional regulator with XRE-family HTH domain